MCTEQDLTCVSSVYAIDFTYVSDVNGTYSTIDHFITSNSLNTCVDNYCTVNDIDNMSDHLPNKSPRSGWKEHVAMYRAEAMNWHALWLSCGCPSF